MSAVITNHTSVSNAPARFHIDVCEPHRGQLFLSHQTHLIRNIGSLSLIRVELSVPIFLSCNAVIDRKVLEACPPPVWDNITVCIGDNAVLVESVEYIWANDNCLQILICLPTTPIDPELCKVNIKIPAVPISCDDLPLVTRKLQPCPGKCPDPCTCPKVIPPVIAVSSSPPLPPCVQVYAKLIFC